MSTATAAAINSFAPAGATPGLGFIRRNTLQSHEYRKKFTQIDDDAIALVTSPEATKVTTLMSKIYLRLVNAPFDFWAGDESGELHFRGEMRGDKMLTAHEQLLDHLGVASNTATKALRWLHEKGAIGYCARKNGAGIRIWLNRAVSSIGTRPTLVPAHRATPPTKNTPAPAQTANSLADGQVSFAPPTSPNLTAPAATRQLALVPPPASSITPVEQKNLPVSPAAEDESPASPSAVPFKRIVLESLDKYMIPRGDTAPPAPQTAAGTAPGASHTTEFLDPGINLVIRQMAALEAKLQAQEQRQATWQQQAVNNTREAAERAARQHAQAQADLRRWFDEKGLPKAIRIAQREAFDLLRRAGYPAAGGSSLAGRESSPPEPETETQPLTARVLTLAEIEEFAAQCAHNWQHWAHPIDESLAAFSASQPFSATETAAIREQTQRVLAGASVPANPFLLAR